MSILGLLTLALSAGAVPEAAAPRLAVIRQAPDFVLTDQDGKVVRGADLRGRVLLVSFVFTTCNGTCPATTHRMSLVAQALQDHDLFKGGRVRSTAVSG